MKSTELSTSESVASEIDQIEHLKSLKRIDRQQKRWNDGFVDTNIEMELNTEVEILLK